MKTLKCFSCQMPIKEGELYAWLCHPNGEDDPYCESCVNGLLLTCDREHIESFGE